MVKEARALKSRETLILCSQNGGCFIDNSSIVDLLITEYRFIDAVLRFSKSLPPLPPNLLIYKDKRISVEYKIEDIFINSYMHK